MIGILVLFFLLTFTDGQGQIWQRLIENPFNFEGARACEIAITEDPVFVSSIYVVVDSIANTKVLIFRHDSENGDLIHSKQYFSNEYENTGCNISTLGDNLLYPTNDDNLGLDIN